MNRSTTFLENVWVHFGNLLSSFSIDFVMKTASYWFNSSRMELKLMECKDFRRTSRFWIEKKTFCYHICSYRKRPVNQIYDVIAP